MDIAAAIADKLGMKLEVTDMEFDSLIPALQSDTVDVALAGMTVTPALAEEAHPRSRCPGGNRGGRCPYFLRQQP